MVEALSILKVCLIFLPAAIFNCLVFLWTHHYLDVSFCLKVLILTLYDLILDSDLLCYAKNRTYIVFMHHSFNAAILLSWYPCSFESRSHSVVQAGLQQSSYPILWRDCRCEPEHLVGICVFNCHVHCNVYCWAKVFMGSIIKQFSAFLIAILVPVSLAFSHLQFTVLRSPSLSWLII